MKAIGVIPTRYASIRFHGNSLKKILRKPLLQWVIEGARQSKLLSEIWVATDHPSISANQSGLLITVEYCISAG